MSPRRPSSNWIKRIEKWVERNIRQNARIFARGASTLLRHPILKFLSASLETTITFAVDVFGLGRRMANELWEVIRTIADRTLKNRGTRLTTALLSLGISSFGITYLAHGIQLGGFIAALPVSLVTIPITLCAMAASLWRDAKNLSTARRKQSELTVCIQELHSLITRHNRGEIIQENFLELRTKLVQAKHQLRKIDLEVSKYQLKCASQIRSMFFLAVIFAGIIGLAFPPVGISLIILGSMGWIATAVKYKATMQTLEARITAVDNLPAPSAIAAPYTTTRLFRIYKTARQASPRASPAATPSNPRVLNSDPTHYRRLHAVPSSSPPTHRR